MTNSATHMLLINMVHCCKQVNEVFLQFVTKYVAHRHESCFVFFMAQRFFLMVHSRPVMLRDKVNKTNPSVS